MLDYLVVGIGIYIDVLLLNIFVRNFRRKYSLNIIVFVYVVYGIIIFCINMLELPTLIRLLFNFILIIFIMNKFYATNSILDPIRRAFIFMTILAAFEIIAILLMSWIEDMYELEKLISATHSWVIMMFISKVGSLVVFLRMTAKRAEKSTIGNTIGQLLLFLVPAIVVALIIIEMLKIEDSTVHVIFPILLLVAMMAIVYTVSNIVFIKMGIELKESKLEVDMLKKKNQYQYAYYKEKMETEHVMRKIYHDLKNSTIIMKKSNSEAEKYTENVMEVLENFDLLKDTGNEMLNIVVREKLKIMKEKNIKYCHSILSKFYFTLEDIDTCILFGNLFDNAIEACDKIVNNAERRIEFTIEKMNDIYVVQLKNSVKTDGKILLNNGEFVTSKEDKKAHGYGICSIKEILKNYDADINYKIEKGAVLATLLFYSSK